jgi:hypothetical protein
MKKIIDYIEDQVTLDVILKSNFFEENNNHLYDEWYSTSASEYVFMTKCPFEDKELQISIPYDIKNIICYHCDRVGVFKIENIIDLLHHLINKGPSKFEITRRLIIYFKIDIPQEVIYNSFLNANEMCD